MECPFEVCIHEDSKDSPKKMRGTMARRVKAKELQGVGKTHGEIASEIGVSPRTVWRYLSGCY